jgi:hypothetical protein
VKDSPVNVDTSNGINVLLLFAVVCRRPHHRLSPSSRNRSHKVLALTRHHTYLSIHNWIVSRIGKRFPVLSNHSRIIEFLYPFYILNSPGTLPGPTPGGLLFQVFHLMITTQIHQISTISRVMRLSTSFPTMTSTLNRSWRASRTSNVTYNFPQLVSIKRQRIPPGPM